MLRPSWSSQYAICIADGPRGPAWYPTGVLARAVSSLSTTIAFVGWLLPIDALACDWLGPIWDADLRELADEYVPMTGEALEAPSGGVWWVHRPEGDFALVGPDGAGIEAELAYLSEGMLGLRVPESEPGAAWRMKTDVEDATDETWREFIVSEGISPNPVPLPDIVVAEVGSRRFEEAQGCSGFVDVLERGEGMMRLGFSFDPSEDVGIDLWNLPTGDSVVEGESPQAFNNASLSNMMSGSELTIRTNLSGERTFHFRLVDRAVGTTGPLHAVDLGEIVEETKVGTIWAGISCGAMGADGLPPMGVLVLVAFGLSRRRSAHGQGASAARP